jgi:nitrogenase molybdenum-iron protein beta chain
LEGLFRGYVKRGLAKRQDTVNLLGLVPGQDAFYKGNLAEIKRLLEALGLRVNTFFGEGESLENLRDASEASLNIVLSDLYGVKAAKAFEEIHGVPWLSLPLPIGAAQTKEFLLKAANAAGVGSGAVEALIQKEEARYYDYLERAADIYNDIDLQRYAVIAGDINYAPAVSRFVADELGWLPVLSVITDFVDDNGMKLVESRFQAWESGAAPLVKFSADTSSIRGYLKEAWPQSKNEPYYDSMTPAVIIGSVFERDLAAQYGLPLLALSFPVTNRVVFNQTYAGYNGGLALAADLLSLLVAGR